MTENRKRVDVNVTGQQRVATIRAPVQAVSREVAVTILPVREQKLPPYEGAYEASPTFDGQVLATRGLRMLDDVTIDPIYVADTTNPAGGITVFIGGEFNG